MWWFRLSIHALEKAALCASWEPDGEENGGQLFATD
jgi:hypothetical protein